MRKAVGRDKYIDIKLAIEDNRWESWVVTTRPDGSTVIEVLDALAKPKPVDTSKILIKGMNGYGVLP